MLSEEEYSRLGLTTLQGQVLITLMELGGEASAPEIFKKLSKSHKINRTSIYTVLAKLEYLGLVLSKEGGRGNNFSLVATSPKVLLSKILEPQKPVLEKFEKQLRAAKEQQSTKIEYELYYLQNRDQIRNQLELIIEQADKYLLLMATATMMDDIIDLISNKEKISETAILVIPTWNPDQKLNMDDLVQKYRNILKPHQVTNPLPIFERIVPMMLKYTKGMDEELLSLSSQTYFAMALTESEILMATHLGDVSGSGFYSREPMISQMMHIIYLSLFEEISDIDPSIIQEVSNLILDSKTRQTMHSLRGT